MLRVRVIYAVFTWFYFFMLKRLFKYADRVHDYLDRKYEHVIYQLRSDYHVDANNNNSDVGKDECQEEKREVQYYQINNYLYKPNV